MVLLQIHIHSVLPKKVKTRQFHCSELTNSNAVHKLVKHK